jgi:type I restriction enzyme R subunit
MDKKQLTETDIINKFIRPAVIDAGWDDMTQIREEVKLHLIDVVVEQAVG